MFEKQKDKLILLLVFVVALYVRFLYFPENVYFGFDQARDAYESINIYSNFDLKIIGPSAAMEGVFHGPLYWYLIGPFYLLGNGNPAFAAGFLLVLNALGVFLIYFLAKGLFDKRVGLISATIYAFSFEQTQYAMYFGNPAPAVLTILLFYLGFVFFISKKDWRGLPLAIFAYGLSVQFEFFLVYLGLIFLIIILLFRKEVRQKLNRKTILMSLLAFALSFSTFILAEIRYGFMTTRALLTSNSVSGQISLSNYVNDLSVRIHDNIIALPNNYLLAVLFILIIAVLKARSKDYNKIVFLLIWVLSSSVVYFFGPAELYYINIGISAGLIVLFSYVLSLVAKKRTWLMAFVVIVVALSNLDLTYNQNPNGIINSIYVQEGMLLAKEKQSLDYIYKQAVGKPIAVSAITMPLNINTTWAYLFNWYGKERYGYLPYWAGSNADGYPGSLPRWTSQEKDYVFFSIIEPRRGVRQAFIDNFFDEQMQYGDIMDSRAFGELEIQRRR